jgi:hypothetical protein
MAPSSVLARIGLVSAVAVILGISTLSPLLKPASDFGRPAVSGPPLYQTASMPVPVLAEQGAPAGDARGKLNRLTSTATALLALPPSAVAERPAVPPPPGAQRPVPQGGTTALAAPTAVPSQPQQAAATGDEPLPPAPIVAESDPQPKPEKRAPAAKRPKKARTTQPPIYTRAVQMSVY